ncbi:MAG: PA14 domain-containing protein [Flavobacterium sp.]|nr:PA14 domain-containing protein [Flavobacterium sp.]
MNNHKIYSFLLFVFFISYGLNAQTVSTYFGFNSNSNPQNLITDTKGNLYFMIEDYTNQRRSIKKIDSNGIITSIISVSTNDQIYYQNLITDSMGNLYFTTDDYTNNQRSIKKVDSGGTTTSIIIVSTNDSIYFQNLVTDTMGNLYFVTDDYTNEERSITKVDSYGTKTSIINVSTNDPINFQNLVTDTMGNLYFTIEDYNSNQRSIKKVDVNGNITSILDASTNDSIYFNYLVTDTSGNLYFMTDDYTNNQRSIKKVDSDGNTSSILNVSTNYPINSLLADTLGNLYFTTDDYTNNQRSIKKIESTGNITSIIIVSTNDPIYFNYLITDSTGNLYFTTDDYTNNQRSIKKVDSGGTTTSIISVSTNDPINFQNLITDTAGNFYFIEDNNGIKKIMIVTNPNYVCPTPEKLTALGASVCGGITTVLSASGIGDLFWFDAPTGGNLLASGNDFTTPVINADMTYYVEGIFCNVSSFRTPVTVVVFQTPIATISGDTTGNDFVSLTASGIGVYRWSGGYAPTQAVNYFTRTGTYTLTVTNAGGCFSTANVSVVVNKLGITKYGELIGDTTLKVNKNGTINAINYLNKHGKSSSSIPKDGKLNYAVFTAPASHPNNSNDFASYTNTSNQTSSGASSANLLLDWANFTVLTNANISIPNGGNRFAVQVSGFFIPEESGTYTFTCEGDDAVDLFIDTINVANHYGGHGIEALGSHTGTKNLVEGTKYTFRVRMQENGGGEGLRVYWRRPSESSGWNIYTSELSSE